MTVGEIFILISVIVMLITTFSFVFGAGASWRALIYVWGVCLSYTLPAMFFTARFSGTIHFQYIFIAFEELVKLGACRLVVAQTALSRFCVGAIFGATEMVISKSEYVLFSGGIDKNNLSLFTALSINTVMMHGISALLYRVRNGVGLILAFLLHAVYDGIADQLGGYSIYAMALAQVLLLIFAILVSLYVYRPASLDGSA